MWEIFATFFKIGLFTFGGGYAMVPLIEEQVVKQKGWLDEAEFLEFLSMAQGLPGAMAIDLANFIGFKVKGHKGQAMACLGTALPSFLIILAIAFLMGNYPVMDTLQPGLNGMLPAIAILIIYAAYNLGKKTPKTKLNIALFLGALLAIQVFKVNPVWVMVAGVILGILRSAQIKKEVNSNDD